MSATYPGGYGVAAIRSVGDATALRATDWLCLGAAPTFAIMALLTGVFGGQTDIFCSAEAPTSPLTGMIPMYLLMSAFHSSPWLKLVQPEKLHRPAVIEPPHSNRRSPPMLSGRWQRWLASERALPRPIRFQRPASTTARPLLWRQTP
jgi:hypothetical protein